MKLARLLCIVFFACTLTSFHKASTSKLTDDVSADIGALMYCNEVHVWLYRTDPDAGCICFKVDIWFNSESNWQTFNFCMGAEYSKEEIVQGPCPTGFAGIKTQPYDIVPCNSH
jgi:glucose dehydrogenase